MEIGDIFEMTPSDEIAFEYIDKSSMNKSIIINDFSTEFFIIDSYDDKILDMQDSPRDGIEGVLDYLNDDIMELNFVNENVSRSISEDIIIANNFNYLERYSNIFSNENVNVIYDKTVIDIEDNLKNIGDVECFVTNNNFKFKAKVINEDEIEYEAFSQGFNSIGKGIIKRNEENNIENLVKNYDKNGNGTFVTVDEQYFTDRYELAVELSNYANDKYDELSSKSKYISIENEDLYKKDADDYGDY